MSFTPSELAGIAHLARLKFSEDEIPGFADDLSRIIDFVQQLSECDTKDVTPMAHPLDMTQRLRPDTVNEEDGRDCFQRNAAATKAGFYLVPKVIDSST